VLAGLLPADATQIDLQLPEHDLLGRGPVSAELAAGRLTLLPAVAYAVADRPDKRRLPLDDLEFGTLMAGAESNMLGTRTQLVVVSPYLVPGKPGMALLRSLEAKGVEQTVVTNSLASNDSALVYFSYAHYRMPMAQAGVKLYEISAAPTGNSLSLFGGSSRGRLHAKLMVIDSQTVLLGSLNLDPRSARKNTEVGVAIDSPAIAAEALRVVDAMETEAYRVQLESPGGGLSWVPPNEDDDQAIHAEPGMSALNILERLVLRPLVPEDQL
jgi:putative cardiolipin synthase